MVLAITATGTAVQRQQIEQQLVEVGTPAKNALRQLQGVTDTAPQTHKRQESLQKEIEEYI